VSNRIRDIIPDPKRSAGRFIIDLQCDIRHGRAHQRPVGRILSDGAWARDGRPIMGSLSGKKLSDTQRALPALAATRDDHLIRLPQLPIGAGQMTCSAVRPP
jgi:hypothetical protein